MVKRFIFLYLGLIASFNAYGQTQEAQEKFQYKAPEYLYEEKCSKCHTLERVFAETKTEDEWRICVARMMAKARYGSLIKRGNGSLMKSFVEERIR